MAHIAREPCLSRKTGNRIGILPHEEKHREPSQPNDPFHFLSSRPAGIGHAGADLVESRIRNDMRTTSGRKPSRNYHDHQEAHDGKT